MTFEETDTLARSPGGESRAEAARPRFQPPQWDNKATEEMLHFVDQAALVADDLRGLARLLKCLFEMDCSRLSLEEDRALSILGECIGSMASRLDLNAERARERRNHLAAGAGR